MRKYIRDFSMAERLGKYCLNSAKCLNREMAGGIGLSVDMGSRKHAVRKIDVEADSNKAYS
jgi:hypothetical protein